MKEKYKFDLIPFRCAQRISNDIHHFVNVNFREDHFCDSMVGHLEILLAGKKYETIKISYPKNWIESLKERFAPEWLLHQYPVVYTNHEINASRFFPDYKVPPPEERFGKSVFWYNHLSFESKEK